MRELSMVELDLIVGGYGESYDGGYSYGNDTSLTSDADGNVSGTVNEDDQGAVESYASSLGIESVEVTITFPIPKIGNVTAKIGSGKKK